MEKFEQIIGYTFRDKRLLLTALTHSSYANENAPMANNERMEFFGDAILEFVSSEYFFKNMKTATEGFLTRTRAAAVCEKSLAKFARSINLGSYLRLGKGLITEGGADSNAILSDAFEALIAAIYLDAGIENAKNFILPFLATCERYEEFIDYKTILQEVVQANPGEMLEYAIVAEYGPEHERNYEAEVHLNSNIFSKGIGRSKKKAEQEAAKAALELMGIKL